MCSAAFQNPLSRTQGAGVIAPVKGIVNSGDVGMIAWKLVAAQLPRVARAAAFNYFDRTNHWHSARCARKYSQVSSMTRRRARLRAAFLICTAITWAGLAAQAGANEFLGGGNIMQHMTQKPVTTGCMCPPRRRRRAGHPGRPAAICPICTACICRHCRREGQQ
jgi:hypothetical protein